MGYCRGRKIIKITYKKNIIMLKIYVIMRGCRVCFSVENENLAKENVKVLNEYAGMPLYHYQESKFFYQYNSK